MPSPAAVLAVLATLGAAPALFAAERPAAGLAEVVVTGHLEEDLPLDLAQFGTRVDVVTAAQVRNGGYLDVAQTLQSLTPGLYISPKNGPFDYADVSLFGSRTQDVLWLVDGVRINNRLYGGTTPLDTLPASMVDHIAVLEGPQALFYGTQGVAGVVDVVTKSFSGQPDGAVALGGDTNSGTHLDGYYGNGFGNQQLVLFGSSDRSSGFRPFRAEDFQPSSTDRDRAYNIRTFGVKYAFTPADSTRLSATYQHTEGRVDYAQPAYVATAFNERDEDILSAKLDYTLSERVQLYVKGYFHNWRSHYTEFDNDPSDPATLITIDDHDFWGFKDTGANAVVQFTPGRGLDYYLGADYQSYSGRDAVLVISQKSEHVQAFFAEVATNSELSQNGRFALGMRYNDPSEGQPATVWSASGKYSLPQGMFVRALVGTAFRLPTAEELFADDPQDERGNPNLKPERSTNVNASIGGVVGVNRLKWELIGFYRKIEDLISFDGFDPVTNQSLAENVAGEVSVHGAELALEGQLTNQLSGNLSFMVDRARQAGDLQIARVPEQQAKLSLDFHPGGAWGAGLALNYVGKVFQSVWDGREQFGNYVVADVTGRVYLDSARHQLITARLQNAFDRQYATSLGTTQRDSDGSDYTYWNLGVPRTFSIRYTYQF